MRSTPPAQQLVELQKVLVEHRRSEEKLISQRKDLELKINRIRNNITTNEKKVHELLEISKEPIITDHAIIRYLERVKKLDIEELKKEMIPEGIKNKMYTLGSGKFPINGYTAIVKSNMVVTITIEKEE